jgi:hypothetical protein
MNPTASSELAAPAVHLLRCNPYGHSTGPGGDRGPKHLMGGLYGPQYEGPQKWACESFADGWYVMTCGCGHKGQRMPLCYPHVMMIGRRQSGICPPCVMPPGARELWEDIQRAQAAVVALHLKGAPASQIKAGVDRAENLSLEMTGMYLRGLIHRCPLTLTEVS